MCSDQCDFNRVVQAQDTKEKRLLTFHKSYHGDANNRQHFQADPGSFTSIVVNVRPMESEIAYPKSEIYGSTLRPGCLVEISISPETGGMDPISHTH